MKIRRLAEDDLVGLSGLYAQFWGEESSLEQMRATFRRLAENPRYLLLVAEEAGCLIGSVMGIICEELYGECKPFMVIEDVIVDRQHRRAGIGSALMRELERCAMDSGCSYVIFVTETERVAAQCFYASLGYALDTHKGFKKKL
jgi:ribosomal protein S18 acetylase RimI-like enzyme